MQTLQRGLAMVDIGDFEKAIKQVKEERAKGLIIFESDTPKQYKKPSLKWDEPKPQTHYHIKQPKAS